MAKDDIGLPSEKNTKTRWMMVGVSLLGALLIGVLVWFFAFSGGKNNTIDTTKKDKADTSEVNTNVKPDPNAKAWEKEDSLLPIKFEKWQTEDFSLLEKPESPYEWGKKKGVDVWTKVSVPLPCEEEGFTNDISRQFNEDGGLNTMYAYWTCDAFKSELATIVERFINPVFGGWTPLQYPHSEMTVSQASLFDDIMSSDFKNNNADKQLREAYPLFADWDNNNYGRDDFAEGSTGRFIGELTSGNIDMDYDQETLSYRGTFTGDVTYKAYLNDENTAEKKARITFTFKPNPSGDAQRRIVVDSAQLEVLE